MDQYKFLLDCGEGTQWQLLKNGIRYQKIQLICITHLHGDHYLGLMGLLNTMSLNGRRDKLTIISPPGLERIFRLHMELSDAHDDFPIEWIETDPAMRRLVWSDDIVQIESIPLHHRIPCNGYLIRYREIKKRIHLDNCLKYGIPPHQFQDVLEGRMDQLFSGVPVSELVYREEILFRYAYLTDTQYLPALAASLGKVELLFHEATFLNNLADRAKQTHHSTALQAALFAKEAGAAHLMIGHFSSRYRELEAHLEEAKRVFSAVSLASESTVSEWQPIINRLP